MEGPAPRPRRVTASGWGLKHQPAVVITGETECADRLLHLSTLLWHRRWLQAMQNESKSDMRQHRHRWTEICPQHRNRLAPSSKVVHNKCYNLYKQMAFGLLSLNLNLLIPFLKVLKLLQYLLFYRGKERNNAALK